MSANPTEGDARVVIAPLGDVLVTGATGLLGRHVVKCLAGHPGVDGLYLATRAPESSPAVSRGRCVSTFLDLTRDVQLPNCVRTLIHVAGEKRDESRMRLVNESGTRRLIEAAASAGVMRFVYVSSVGVYGAGPGAGRIDESSAHVPMNEYERSKQAGEEALHAAGRAPWPDVVVLRPSNVIGFDPDGGHLPLLGLVRSITRGVFTRFGPAGRSWLNYVDVGDVARAIVAAAERAPAGGEYIVNGPARLDDAVRWIADECGVEEPRRRLPVLAGRILAVIVPSAARLFGRVPPFDGSRLRELTNDTIYDPSRLGRVTGFGYAVGPEELFRRLARHYRESGLC